MGHENLAWAWDQDVKGSDKLLLVFLADQSNDNYPVSWYGQDTLAEKCRVTSRAIRASLVRLEEAGLIERAHRQRKNGSRTSDLITLLADSNRKPTSGDEPVLPEVDGRSNRKPTSGPDSEVEPGDSFSKSDDQTSLDIDGGRVDLLLSWHGDLVKAKTGKRPAVNATARKAAADVLRWLDAAVGEKGAAAAMKRMWTFSQGEKFWADKVLTLPSWRTNYERLMVASSAAEEQGRSRGKRDEPYEPPKPRGTRYDQERTVYT